MKPLSSTGMGRAARWVATLATVAALSLARDVLAPLAIAALFAFLLAPVAARLERLRLGRGLSACVCVLLLGGAATGALALVANQVIELSRELPTYRENIRDKFEALQGAQLSAPVAAAKEGLDKIDAELDRVRPPSTEPTPVKVSLVADRPGAVGALGDQLGPLLPLFGTALVVLIVTAFLIAFRSDIRERLIRLLSAGEIVATNQALDEAALGVSRFLASALLVNTVYGALLTVGLWALGIPNFLLWGLFSLLLRFVPLFGVWIAAVFPVVTAFAVFDGWWMTGAVLVLVLAVEVLVANVLEPIVYGRRVGMSPLAVVLATVFWTWLWGGAGLLLAVPVTLCLTVAGRYVPGLGFLETLFGAGSPLPVRDRLYHRWVHRDVAGAAEILEAEAVGATLDAALDATAFPALAVAAADLRRGVLGVPAFAAVCESARFALTEAEAATPHDTPTPGERAGRDARHAALLVPVGTEADAVTCEVLARRLEDRGVPTVLVAPNALIGEIAAGVSKHAPAVIVLAGLPPLAEARVRHLAKRLRPLVPPGRLVAAVWGSSFRDAERAALRVAGVDETAGRVRDAVERVVGLAAHAAATAAHDEPAHAGGAVGGTAA